MISGDIASILEGVTSKPVAPIGLVVMPGAEKLGEQVNSYLMHWKDAPENGQEVLLTTFGENKDSFIINVSCPRFGSGEGKALIRESVRGYDLYILSDVTNYSIEYEMYGRKVPMSPDNHYNDLKRVICAASNTGYRVNVIMPFLFESRQHKRTGRESLDCAMCLQELDALGVANIITFDAHDPRVVNAMPMGGFQNIMPTYQNIKTILKKVPNLQIDKEHMMVISPDEGAAGRNIYYATTMGLNMGMFYKRRDYTTIVNGRNPIVAHEYLGDSVEGKDVIIADDILATGDSLLDLAKKLKAMKCRRIIMIATFGLFTMGIQRFKDAYAAGLFDYLVTTNLNYLPEEYLSEPWLLQANLSKYLAYIIATLNHNRSIETILDPVGRINRIMERYRSGEFGQQQ